MNETVNYLCNMPHSSVAVPDLFFAEFKAACLAKGKVVVRCENRRTPHNHEQDIIVRARKLPTRKQK